MKNVIVAGVAALALVGCGAKEEAAVEAAPVEAATPAPEAAVEGEVPADAQVAVGEVSSSEPAKEPAVVAPAEAAK
jgi:type IV pilus biogenesis protein CpaD/CtpE